MRGRCPVMCRFKFPAFSVLAFCMTPYQSSWWLSALPPPLQMQSSNRYLAAWNGAVSIFNTVEGRNRKESPSMSVLAAGRLCRHSPLPRPQRRHHQSPHRLLRFALPARSGPVLGEGEGARFGGRPGSLPLPLLQRPSGTEISGCVRLQYSRIKPPISRDLAPRGPGEGEDFGAERGSRGSHTLRALDRLGRRTLTRAWQ